MLPAKRILSAAVALATLACFNGCASVTRGTKDTLVVESDPSGAVMRLSTGHTGKTPTSFRLPRKRDVDVHIEKEGYEPLDVHVSSQVSGYGATGMAGNVLIGGLIGVGVDAFSGATKDLRPNPVKVTLVPLKAKEEKPVSNPTEEPSSELALEQAAEATVIAVTPPAEPVRE